VYRKLTKSIKNISCGAMALPIGVLMLTTGGTAVSAPVSMPPTFPSLSLPMPKSNGVQAVQALEQTGSIAAIAAAYGKTEAELAKLIRNDKTIWLDKDGHMFIVEEAPDPVKLKAYIAQSAPSFVEPLVPLNQTFNLHSNPNAKRIIYLDFDGHTITGTAWNKDNMDPINAAPYDRDNNPGFSNAELTNIQEIWQKVSEDYAPFDVDVTTELQSEEQIRRTDSNDEYYGTRALVTRSNFGICDHCGGIAYVGSYNDTGEMHDYYMPALVFFDRLDNGNPKSVAEAISHEVGHNLKLFHDGTSDRGYYAGHGSAETGWAPIMGVGYYRNLVQWSRGEYNDANNQEDDFQIIQNSGLPLIAEDHDRLNSNASQMTSVVNGEITTVSSQGIVGIRTDIDAFKFSSGTGSISIAINPVADAPNLDIKAELYNANNQLVASSNPADLLAAQIKFNSTQAQTYYLKISGSGKGNPMLLGYSDYGSMGKYFISGQVPTFIAIHDTDGDGMTDAWESSHGSNPLVPDANADADGDGYTNIEEYSAEENPKLDRDNDGMFDAWEMENGLDINDSSDCPSWVCRTGSQGGWRSILYK
jgi:hypothetical protein